MPYDGIVEMLQATLVDRRPWWRRALWWLRQHSPWQRRGYTRSYTPTPPGEDRRLYPGLEIRPRQKERPHQWHASNQHRRRYRHTATIRRPKIWGPGADATPVDTSGATGS